MLLIKPFSTTTVHSGRKVFYNLVSTLELCIKILVRPQAVDRTASSPLHTSSCPLPTWSRACSSCLFSSCGTWPDADPYSTFSLPHQGKAFSNPQWQRTIIWHTTLAEHHCHDSGSALLFSGFTCSRHSFCCHCPPLHCPQLQVWGHK